MLSMRVMLNLRPPAECCRIDKQDPNREHRAKQSKQGGQVAHTHTYTHTYARTHVEQKKIINTLKRARIERVGGNRNSNMLFFTCSE